MLKLLKWIYDLGWQRGYEQGQLEPPARFINPKPKQSDEDFMAEVDEVLGNG